MAAPTGEERISPRSSPKGDLDSAIVELLLVTLDPVFRLRRKNIEKLSLAGRDHFNHLCDHVLWIESPLWFTEQPVDHLLEGFALDKVHVIAEPAQTGFHYSFVETGKVGSGIDRLDLDSEGLQLFVHRFSYRLHGVFARGICGNWRDAEKPNS